MESDRRDCDDEDAERIALEECERRRNRDEDHFDTGESDGK